MTLLAILAGTALALTGTAPAYAQAKASKGQPDQQADADFDQETYGTFNYADESAGAAFGAGIALLYGTLWVLLQMEQRALVIGSLMLFGMLAAVMVLTRRVDWYGLFGGLRKTAAAA